MLRKIICTVAVCLCLIPIVSANENKVFEVLQSQKEEAISLYKKNKYNEAYQLFSKLYLSALSDVKINFLLGRSAFETGRYEIALAAYERVEMLDPTNIRNQLEMARTQYQSGMLEDARIGFTEVLSNPNIPENVRTNIELFVSKIDNKLQKSFFFGTVSLIGVYDSNISCA